MTGVQTCALPIYEEAKQNIRENCSAIGHGAKGSYIGYETLPVQCIIRGIKRAEKELKLRVPMGIEWAVGRNWQQCH